MAPGKCLTGGGYGAYSAWQLLPQERLDRSVIKADCTGREMSGAEDGDTPIPAIYSLGPCLGDYVPMRLYVSDGCGVFNGYADGSYRNMIAETVATGMDAAALEEELDRAASTMREQIAAAFAAQRPVGIESFSDPNPSPARASVLSRLTVARSSPAFLDDSPIPAV